MEKGFTIKTNPIFSSQEILVEETQSVEENPNANLSNQSDNNKEAIIGQRIEDDSLNPKPPYDRSLMEVKVQHHGNQINDLGISIPNSPLKIHLTTS